MLAQKRVLNTMVILSIILFLFHCETDSTKIQRLWDKEASLWEIAQEVTFSHLILKDDPQPVGMWNGGTALNLSTKELKMSLWGPSDQLTISVNKTDVWDRRKFFEPPLTLDQIVKRFDKDKIIETDRWNYYRSWKAYDFPCPKPVGQIILRIPELAGAGPPLAVRRCDNGTATLEFQHKGVQARVSYLPMMTQNVIALYGEFSGLEQPVSLRLYRHKDTAEFGKAVITYGGPEAKTLKDYDFSKDQNNAPPAPPESGTDGDIFWIRQRLPAEKTFPNGFEYIFAGCLAGTDYDIETVDGDTGLGTPPFLSPENEKRMADGYRWQHLFPTYKKIREATGAAATATIHQTGKQKFIAYITVVTSAEATDPLPEAKRKLKEARANGYKNLIEENAEWYHQMYSHREKGRVFKGNTDSTRKQIPEIFNSWPGYHSKFCLPDPIKFQADVEYGYLEQDWAPWHGLPCYNEVYYTHLHVANRADRILMWNHLVPFWLEACKKNAREVFNLPGGILQHGYLPPIKADTYAHSTSVWEFCMEINAQVLKALWDRFDYGGDEEFLADIVYPAMRETAIFYSHYAKKGPDGYYHIIPTMSAEHWGWTARFERNRDTASALCMFRWLLNRATEAADLLQCDTELIPKWQEVSQNLAPLPTFQTDKGPIFTDALGVNPIGVAYNWFAGVTPTLLADEINLDSDSSRIEMMLRTACLTKGWRNHYVYTLLAGKKGFGIEHLINSRSRRIYLFPAIPDSATIGFKDLQARDGFEVSAECLKGIVTYVEISARRTVPCQVINPWKGEKIRVIEKSSGTIISHIVDTDHGECIKFSAKKGKRYLIIRN